MKKFILLLLISLNSFAQINIMQDQPKSAWKQIENQYFKVIYPQGAKKDAIEIFSFLNTYQTIVARTYNVQAKQIPIILRTQTATPNGFVTLAPRRSEWFSSANISPFVGSLPWYQSLAVHEYRHVIQIDHLKRSNLRIPYILFGETLHNGFINFSMPMWYFEGDAVWSETAYSDGGRGRSPRFTERLKSLIISNNVPEYDELLAGNLNNYYPNHYVYGYFLITNGVIRFGSDIWRNVTARASDEPLNPFAFYDAFWEITGLEFENFYNQTMNTLKIFWKDDIDSSSKIKKFELSYYPKAEKNNLFYLKKDLEHHWRLFKNKNPITEINSNSTLSKPDFKNHKLLYTQEKPNHRYLLNSYSDIFTFDVNNNLHTQITTNKRYYHPQYNHDGTKIVAISYEKNNLFEIHIINQQNEVIKKIKSTKQYKFIEAIYKDDSSLFSIAINNEGNRQILQISLDHNEIIPLTPPSKNNLYSLHFHKILYFEADYKGTVNIFGLNPDSLALSQCTFEKVGAKMPAIYNNQLFYSKTVSYGSVVARSDLDCMQVQSIDLFQNYLSSGPSDSFTNTKKVSLEDLKHTTSTAKESHYNEYENSLTPHSWAYNLSQGWYFQAQTTNYLNTLKLSSTIGSNAQEESPFALFQLNYAKYYPIINFGLSYTKRRNILFNIENKWTELGLKLGLTLPYLFKKHLYSGSYLLSIFTEQIQVSDKKFKLEAAELDDEQLTATGVNFNSKYLKKTIRKSLRPAWGYDLNYFYQNITNLKKKNQVSYLGTYDLNLYTPSLALHHSFKLGISGEYRPTNELLYKQQNKYLPIINYTFSRGYSYEYTNYYTKYSLDYALPLWYPNWGLSKWIHFKQVHANLFYDSTIANLEIKKLNSYGIEFSFQSFVIRKFELQLGLRALKKELDSSEHLEFFMTL